MFARDLDRHTMKRRPAGLLRRLARDKSGNTLALVAAAMVPLTAMIGSGIDIGRAYMAKTRLQSACDAAALAGRRMMVGDTMTDDVRAEAVKFFNFNFAPGLYQSDAFTPTVTRASVGTVRVTADTQIRTSIMYMFGYDRLPISATCDASQNFVNTDVMLVLDTTGSMLCTPEEGGDCGRNSEISTSRIVALRDATMALYDALAPTQTQLQGAGMRLRYGVVPYSSTVNVGNLIRAANSGYLADSGTYQSRVPIYSTVATTEAQINSADNSDRCRDVAVTLPRSNINWNNAPISANFTRWTNGRCIRVTGQFTLQATSFWTGAYYYQPTTLDVSQFKTGSSSVPLPTRAPGTTTNATAWNGCIIERDTVSTITASSGLTVPANAHDLNVNLIPTSDATRWKPMWPQASYFRATDLVFDRDTITTDGTRGSGFDYAAANLDSCPAEARRLQAWDRTTMLSYVNGLRAEGSTYHDIGMIWGARMLSHAGIFADSPTTFASMPVAKHIIFMTDGELAPSSFTYSSYGVEFMDQRVTGAVDAPQLYARHLQRFRMACNQAKSMNMSVWVIAFGTGLTQDMTDCASNAQQAVSASNRQQLIDRFTLIGQNIGALRLVQ
jgi:Flp pilus assembly protein TadG